jgi:hypothetical protein
MLLVANNLSFTSKKTNAVFVAVSKPNVIVVQKTQARRPQLPTQITKGGTTVITSPAAFEKVSVLYCDWFDNLLSI